MVQVFICYLLFVFVVVVVFPQQFKRTEQKYTEIHNNCNGSIRNDQNSHLFCYNYIFI